MNTFTTKLKLDKVPLVLQGIDEFLEKWVKITIKEIKPSKKEMQKRPAGLCKGEFTVPDNFNDELPPEIISSFYQG
jgi:hypothetical protein